MHHPYHSAALRASRERLRGIWIIYADLLVRTCKLSPISDILYAMTTINDKLPGYYYYNSDNQILPGPSELPSYAVYAENEMLKEENRRLKAELAEAGNLVKTLTNTVRWLQEHIAKVAQPVVSYITIEESGL